MEDHGSELHRATDGLCTEPAGPAEGLTDRSEVLANAITHGAGVFASIAATIVLVAMSVRYGTAWQVVGSAVFGASLVLLYSASTLYHAVRSPAARVRLRVLDHCAIYILIAGTYTPFTLGAIRGAWGWSLFGVVWGLAVAGVAFKLFFTGRFARLSTAIYIAMGWMCVIAAGPMMRALGEATLLWLVAGGVMYTAGTVAFHSRRRYAHALWHLFVMGGSVCHAIAVGIQIYRG